MSFTDHKITQFVHRVVDLPDQPNLPSDELKARFDSSPEELRVAHNALCDDADRLDDRVSGIIAETFGDTITKSMLSDELADEIDAKATKAELDSEIETLASADTALGNKLLQKCEVVLGSYQGDGNDEKTITLGFAPLAVIVISQRGSLYESRLGRGYGGFALANSPAKYGSSNFVLCTENGFKVFYDSADDVWSNSTETYHYLAFRPVTA